MRQLGKRSNAQFLKRLRCYINLLGNANLVRTMFNLCSTKQKTEVFVSLSQAVWKIAFKVTKPIQPNVSLAISIGT
jgi:hypothetical protein